MRFDGAHRPLSNAAGCCPAAYSNLFVGANRRNLILIAVLMLLQVSGCVSNEVGDDNVIVKYQLNQATKGPQSRADTEGRDLEKPLALLSPDPKTAVSKLQVTTDPKTGQEVYNLTIEQAIVRTLANSPEIRVVSFDPSIAKEQITKAAAEFDVTAFGRLNYEKEDNPISSTIQTAQSDSRLVQSGVRQKGITGSEWSLSYLLTRTWDDLTGRTPSTRYEPILSFQLKQPLLRDAWERVNLAGVNVSRLNHRIALATFRQRAEEVATEVIAAYWVLLQARRDLEIQQELVHRTLETLRKLEGRKEIDATAVQIKQTEASLKAREAILIQAGKRVFDVQDALLQLLADTQINLLEELEIIPVTVPNTAPTKYETTDVLALAILNNPVIQQRRLSVSIADINIEVAENRRMPRLDLVASARTQTLTQSYGEAHDRLDDGNFVSYAVGLSFEYPLGNRQRQAELRRRRFERSKAISELQNIADRIATQAKERIRRLETDYQEMQVQKDAVLAAKAHLQALEDTEVIREKLTPEFLLVKLQSQEDLADSQRAEIRATVDYNVSLARLAQTTGTVLQLHHVQAALPLVADRQNLSD